MTITLETERVFLQELAESQPDNPIGTYMLSVLGYVNFLEEELDKKTVEINAYVNAQQIPSGLDPDIDYGEQQDHGEPQNEGSDV